MDDGGSINQSINQVIDTVELWSLEHQRKISLRFLAAQLLGESIQVRCVVVQRLGGKAID